MPESSRRDLEAITHFLVSRLTQGDSTWVGLSSSAMVAQALTGAADPIDWPMDQADLDRCEESYRRAPTCLQSKMLPTLVRFRRHIAEGGLYCKGCDNSKGHTYTVRGYCRACAGERGFVKPIGAWT